MAEPVFNTLKEEEDALGITPAENQAIEASKRGATSGEIRDITQGSVELESVDTTVIPPVETPEETPEEIPVALDNSVVVEEEEEELVVSPDAPVVSEEPEIPVEDSDEAVVSAFFQQKETPEVSEEGLTDEQITANFFAEGSDLKEAKEVEDLENQRRRLADQMSPIGSAYHLVREAALGAGAAFDTATHLASFISE